MGIFLWLLVGACATPGAAILYAIRWLIKQEWPQLRKALYFPLAGSARWEHRTQRERLLRRFGGTELLLRTEDGRNVHCVWIGHHGSASTATAAQGGAHASPTLSGAAAGAGGSGMTSLGTPPPCETPVVLLLHANAMVLDDMADWAHFYLSQGASVLLLTFWGYPDPSEDGDMPGEEDAADMLFGGGGRGAAEGSAAAGLCPTERSMYLDAEAALRYIQQSRRVPIENTLAHGLSIGGACAASLGYAHPGLRVTLDQTFASLHEVSLHVGAGLYDQLALSRAPRRFQPLVRCAKPLLLRLAACILLRMLFKRDAPPPPSTNQHGGASAGAAPMPPAGRGKRRGSSAAPPCSELDRFDNLRKASLMKGDLYAICSEHDEMMPQSVSTRLLEARYGRGSAAGRELIEQRRLCVPGGHCAFFGEHPEMARKYTQYLVSSGFLPQ